MTEKKDLENILDDTTKSLEDIIKEAREDIGEDLSALSDKERMEVEEQLNIIESEVGTQLGDINIKKLIKMAKKKKKIRHRDVLKKKK